MSLKHDFRQTVVIANIRLPGNHAPVRLSELSRANTAMVFIDRNTDTHSGKGNESRDNNIRFKGLQGDFAS